jgi:hypothetical protein
VLFNTRYTDAAVTQLREASISVTRTSPGCPRSYATTSTCSAAEDSKRSRRYCTAPAESDDVAKAAVARVLADRSYSAQYGRQQVGPQRVPAAIHGPVPVLNSAIAMVAAKHGMTVRLYGPGGRFLTPSQASQMIWTAATDGNPDIGGLTIARDPVAALRIAQIAERGLKTGEIWDE